MPTDGGRDVVTIDGHRLTLTNLGKVLYPEAGTTKAEVLAYYAAVAEPFVAHAAHRPATRKRWVHGTDGPVFFQKNLEDSAPAWVHRREIEHSDHTNAYPLVDDLATLTWLGQIGALEIHVPQWRFGRTGAEHHPDRMVLDLDPGPGVGLVECAQVARWSRDILAGMGLDVFPVTSGSKGIHLYATLDGTQSSEAVSAVAHELARALEADHRDLVVSDMKKSLRTGKVLVDWSQNNRNKTTIAPYSLRGRARPTVAAPRSWAELDDPALRHLEAGEVAERLVRDGDLLADLLTGGRGALEPTPQRMSTFEAGPDRLAVYRSRRDPSKTPEPVPAAVEADDPGGPQQPIFVIQDHHARRHHYDFRLERDGVLVSWALPKGEPTDPSTNHLAVQTEDHPLEYANFAGTIPSGEYGGGTVTIWDAGTYEAEKWREGEEIIAVLHSSGAGGVDRGSRRLALIHTGRSSRDGAENSWLIHRMVERGQAPGTSASASATGQAARAAERRAVPPPSALSLKPMLATPGTLTELDHLDEEDWAFEMKWDGIRALASVGGGQVQLVSRNGVDLTATYPELAELAGCVHEDVLLDGEIVAFNRSGRPDFGLLQNRMNLTRGSDVAAARAEQGVDFMVFDLLHRGSRRMTTLGYDARRAALDAVLDEGGRIHLPPAFQGDARAAIDASLTLGLEGVVAKRRSSTYQPGRRSPAWIKVKHVRTQEVVVVGWRTGNGARADTLGSLLVAVPADGGPSGQLRYAGRVGTGFTDKSLTRLRAELDLLAREGPAVDDVPEADRLDAHWVEPERVGEVSCAGWTSVGRLRHPVWLGWRPDKTPAEVEAPQ
ncbi:ATP-dependent DNA ligase [Sanguibacter suarezii]|uniref:ATP-dependent DNA ligase n=1 Tax=Sanguibacter suarezii TaxID=60921 RepID=UPI00082D8927|nr:ATP-dependent DNA ligase [Sanguibacter suarezii]